MTNIESRQPLTTSDAGSRKALILAAARSTSLPAYASEKFARDAAKQTKQVRRAA